MVQNSHMMQIRAIPPRSPSGLSESIFALGASLYQVCLNHIYPWVIFINSDSVLGEKFGKEVKVGDSPISGDSQGYWKDAVLTRS